VRTLCGETLGGVSVDFSRIPTGDTVADLWLVSLSKPSPSFDFDVFCPLFSTETKLARTFESGLTEPVSSAAVGDRPRDGGDVEFWLLFSNFANRLRTPPEDGTLDIVARYFSPISSGTRCEIY
jgi:hypothetical protein